MPQIFQVLRCYKCSVFQVHQTKKSNKWQCKLCGEKQSIKRHYGLGTSKDCRIHVQKLNKIRGEVDEIKKSSSISSDNSGDDEDIPPPVSQKNIDMRSKWAEYTTEIETIIKERDDNNSLNEQEVVLELPKKRTKISTKINIEEQFAQDIVENEISYENIDLYSNSSSRKVKRFIPPTYKQLKSKPSNVEILKSQYSENEDNAENSDGIHKISKNFVLNDSKDEVGQANVYKSKENPIPLDNVKTNFVNITKCQTENSKWAQFIDNNEEDTYAAKEAISMYNDEKKPNTLFSITEDFELDSILNI